MAVQLWRLGHATEDQFSIWVKSDQDETITWSVNGTDYYIQTDGLDYTGWAITNVLPEKGRTWPFTLDGTITGAGKCMPLDGTPVRIMFGHCAQSYIDMEFGPLIKKHNPSAFIWLGDNPYTTGVLAFNQDLTDSNLNNITVGGSHPTLAEYQTHHYNFSQRPGMDDLTHNIPSYWTRDDHEFPPDNYDHTGESMYDNYILPPGSFWESQYEVNQVYIDANNVFKAYHPDAPYANTTPYIPLVSRGEANATVQNYPVMYFEARVGNVHFIMLDQIGEKSPIDDVDDVNKNILSPTQEQWFYDTILNSIEMGPPDYFLIGCSKPWIDHPAPPFSFLPGGGDGMARYNTQLNRIMDWIATNDVNNVIFIGGDGHQAFIMGNDNVLGYNAANGYDHAYVGMCAGAVSSDVTHAWRGTEPASQHVHFAEDYTTQQHIVGQIDFWPDKAEIKFINTEDEVVFEGEMLHGTKRWDSATTNLLRDVVYTSRPEDGSWSGDETASTWDDTNHLALCTGSNNGGYIAGFSFDPISTIPQGTTIKQAWLQIQLEWTSLTEQGTAELKIASYGGGRTTTPFSQSNLPSNINAWQTHASTIELDFDADNPYDSAGDLNWGLFAPNQRLIDVTALLQSYIDDSNYRNSGTEYLNMAFFSEDPDLYVSLGATRSADHMPYYTPRLVIKADV